MNWLITALKIDEINIRLLVEHIKELMAGGLISKAKYRELETTEVGLFPSNDFGFMRYARQCLGVV